MSGPCDWSPRSRLSIGTLVTDKGRGVGLHGPCHFSNRFAREVLVSIAETSTHDSRSSFVSLLHQLANRLAFESDQVRLVNDAI